MGKGAAFLAGILAVPVLAGATIVAVPKFRETAADWIAKHSTAYQTVVKDNENLSKENEDLLSELDTAETSLVSVNAQLTITRNQLADVNSRLTTATNELTAERAAKAELQTRLNAEIAAKEALQAQLDSALLSIETAQGVIDEKTQTIATLQSQIAAKEATILSLNASIASLNAEIEGYRTEITSLSGQIDELTAFKYGKYVWSEQMSDGSFDDVYVEVLENGKVKFFVDSENFALFDYVQNENRITVNFVEDNEVHPIEFVLTSNASFESTDENNPMSFVYCDENLSVALETRQELQSELASAKNEKASLQSQVDTLTAIVTSLDQQLSEGVAERDRLQAELDEVNATIVSLTAELDEATASVESLTSEVSSLQDEVTMLNETLSELTAEKIELNNQIVDLQSQLAAFEQFTVHIDQTNPVESIVVYDTKTKTIGQLLTYTIPNEISLYNWQYVGIRYASEGEDIIISVNGVETAVNTVYVSSQSGEKVYNITSYTRLSQFKSAIENGGIVDLVDDIDLDETVEITKSTTINLNGHTIRGANIDGAALKVMPEAELTIQGNGSVVGGSGANCRAIEVQGTANIFSGNYFVGPDADGFGNSTIYLTANDATLNIYGGHFESEADWNGFYYVLNLNNNITATVNVYGGEFVNYNPELGDDRLGGNFVVEGYESVLTSESVYTVQEKIVELLNMDFAEVMYKDTYRSDNWLQEYYNSSWQLTLNQMNTRTNPVDGSWLVNMTCGYYMTYRYTYSPSEILENAKYLSVDLGNYYAQSSDIKLKIIAVDEYGDQHYLLGSTNDYHTLYAGQSLTNFEFNFGNINISSIVFLLKSTSNGNSYLYMDNLVVKGQYVAPVASAEVTETESEDIFDITSEDVIVDESYSSSEQTE